MKKIVAIMFVFSFVTILSAQETGEFKPKSDTFRVKKFKKNPKTIYISKFAINLQVYKDAQDTKAGDKNTRKGTLKGKAKAVAAVGLAGLDSELIQAKTNQLYNEFIAELKAKGFTIMNSDQAGATEIYKDWTKESGPIVRASDIPGVITAIPDNYSYYYKQRTGTGKFLEEKFKAISKVPQKLSAELDNAVVAEVDLHFLFTEAGAKDWLKGNAAKVKINVNYRLVNQTVITNIKKHKSMFSMGKQTSNAVNTRVIFVQGKDFVGNAEASYVGLLKKDLEIDGVIKKEKVVAYQKQDEDRITSSKNFALVTDNTSETAKWIAVDNELYTQGFYNAGKQFIFHHLDAFLSAY